MVNKKIQEEEQQLFQLYNRFPLVLDHGEGVYLYDTDGKKYLDFAAGIAVMSLGYQNKELEESLTEQIKKLCHTSNLFYHENGGAAAEALNRVSGMDHVFFTNSGTEAIEGALKTARKYAALKRERAFRDHCHGRFVPRTFYGRSFSDRNGCLQEPFEPLIPGVRFARFNDLDSVKANITDKTCAILLEPLQGEGGIHPATQGFMEGIRALCDEQDILMICDEIQCGMGRTGNMFAWQEYGVRPDILTMAKAIGNGIPVGAFAVTEQVAAHSMKPGDHGTTYGGNPLACMAVKKVVEIFEKDKIVEHVREIAPYLTKRLDELVEETDCVTERRGKGLIQGIVVTKPAGEVINRAIEEGLLIISAKGNVLRFVPPLIIEKEHIDEMIEKLKHALL